MLFFGIHGNRFIKETKTNNFPDISWLPSEFIEFPDFSLISLRENALPWLSLIFPWVPWSCRYPESTSLIILVTENESFIVYSIPCHKILSAINWAIYNRCAMLLHSFPKGNSTFSDDNSIHDDCNKHYTS